MKGGKEQLCKIKDAPGDISLRSEKYKGMKVKLKRNKVRVTEQQLDVRLSVWEGDTDKYLHRLEQSKSLSGKLNLPPSLDRMYRWFIGKGGYLR